MNRPRRGLPSSVLLAVIGLFTLVLLLTVPSRHNLSESAITQFYEAQTIKPKPNDRLSESNKFETAIVSCFFDLNKVGQKTKHFPDFYLFTGEKGVLSFPTPLIFFTDSPEAVIRSRTKVAPNAPMYIFNMSVLDFEVSKKHLKRVTQLVPRDIEAVSAGYSGLLFIIYHAKSEMMARAAKLNPFRTDKFLWMDVGSVRDWGGIEASNYKDKPFPDPSREWLIGRNGKILMGNVAGIKSPCEDAVRWVDAENPDNIIEPKSKVADPLTVRAIPYSWWIAGAIFGGRGVDLIRYNALYDEHLARFLDQDLPHYSLIDQYLMGALACHSDLIEVVRPPLACCVDRVNRQWFFLLMFLKTKDFPKLPYSPEEWKDRAKSRQGLPCRFCHLMNKQ